MGGVMPVQSFLLNTRLLHASQELWNLRRAFTPAPDVIFHPACELRESGVGMQVLQQRIETNPPGHSPPAIVCPMQPLDCAVLVLPKCPNRSQLHRKQRRFDALLPESKCSVFRFV